MAHNKRAGITAGPFVERARPDTIAWTSEPARALLDKDHAMTNPAPTGMHELVLEVHDLEAATRFYTGLLGLPEIDRWSGDRNAVWFDTGDGVALGLWTPETGGDQAIHHGRGGAHVHFALRIPHGSIDEWQQRLEATGKPVTRVDFDNGNHSVYIDDPDGNCVELMDAIRDWSGTSIPANS